jgi:hypothetical protein
VSGRGIHDAEDDSVLALVDVRRGQTIPACAIEQHPVPVVELGKAPTGWLNPSVQDIEIGTLPLDGWRERAERRVALSGVDQQNDNVSSSGLRTRTGCRGWVVAHVESAVTARQLAGEGSVLLVVGRGSAGLQ